MPIRSDSSSVLSGEECEKGLLLLFPTKLLLRHLIGTVGSAPEQLAPCLPSLEAALPTQRLCLLFIKP